MVTGPRKRDKGREAASRTRVVQTGGADTRRKSGAKQRGKERGQEERGISEVGAWSKKEWCRKRTIMEIREEM